MSATPPLEGSESDQDDLFADGQLVDDFRDNEEGLPRLSLVEVRAALDALSAADWDRIDRIAKRRAAGLHHMTPRDLRQQALVDLMASRRWPPGVHPVVVVAKVMHSIASNERKHAKSSPIDPYVEVDPFETSDQDDEPGKKPIVLASTGITPEDFASGRDQFESLYCELEDDADLQLLAITWADEVRGKDAESELNWDAQKYDRERKRLIRRLDAVDPDRRSK